MTMPLIPCVYNSFSFTRNNIFEDMCILDIKTRPDQSSTDAAVYKSKRDTSHSAPPAPPPRPAQNSIVIVSDSETETETEPETETETEPEPEPDTVTDTVTDTVSTFDLLLMSKYLYFPKVQNDTLLWCAYIMIRGIEKFECVENHYTESNVFKFQMVEYIRTKKTLLKPHKIAASSVEESLVHKPYINLETFQAIAVCYNLSVCIIQDRKIFEVGRSDNDKNTFILEKIKGKFGVYIGEGVRDKTALLDHVRERYWSMENITSPIRSISAYKLQDLIDICRKLNIPETKVTLGEFGSIGSEKKKTKPELYEEIVRTIM